MATISREIALPAAPAIRPAALALAAVAVALLAGFGVLWAAFALKGFHAPALLAGGFSLALAGSSEIASGGAIRALIRAVR